jgi:hypothetical protein
LLGVAKHRIRQSLPHKSIPFAAETTDFDILDERLAATARSSGNWKVAIWRQTARPNRRGTCRGKIVHAIRNLSLRRKAAFLGLKFCCRRVVQPFAGNIDSDSSISADR